MPSIAHPFDPESIYRKDDQGNIRITRGNLEGIFTQQGVHISGEIREADPQLCVWVGNVPDVQSMAQDNSTINKRDPNLKLEG
ncbi:MAG: hypothetical protein AAF541_15425 [Pseudomonadota bacterium]